ncbi:hypothetical protein Hdeb2414_s0011g00368161 [Helianthus debilis subsp. tardiflorus]
MSKNPPNLVHEYQKSQEQPQGTVAGRRKLDLIGDIDLNIMGFVVIILTFIVIGIIACICTCVCCNKEPSANLFPLTLANTATI